MAGPLEGLRVLDFTHALAGPYCTMLLADYGASVYKVEPPSGDIGRGWGPPFTGDQSSFFMGLNAGKRGLAIDMKKPEGLELCLQMAAKVDVLIENFRPGALERMGLGYEAARARNPRLIYCSISGFGQTGPAAGDPALDLIVQASSGLMSMTGTAGGQQVRSGHSVADITAGLFALIGILMALRVREQTGVGQFVDIAMQDGLVSSMASAFASYCGSGVAPGPLGTSFASIVPYRTFPARDREIAVAAGSEKLWVAFCEAIERADLAQHPDYATNSLRVLNRGVLEPMLIAIFLEKDAAEWDRRLRIAGVPCSVVSRLDEVFSSPQSAARGMFVRTEHSAGYTFPVTGPPFGLSETPGAVGCAAPKLGQDTRTVLTELLGLPEEDLDLMARRGVLA